MLVFSGFVVIYVILFLIVFLKFLLNGFIVLIVFRCGVIGFEFLFLLVFLNLIEFFYIFMCECVFINSGKISFFVVFIIWVNFL